LDLSRWVLSIRPFTRFFESPPTQKLIKFKNYKSGRNSWMGRWSLIIITYLYSAQRAQSNRPLHRFLWSMVQLATINREDYLSFLIIALIIILFLLIRKIRSVIRHRKRAYKFTFTSERRSLSPNTISLIKSLPYPMIESV